MAHLPVRHARRLGYGTGAFLLCATLASGVAAQSPEGVIAGVITGSIGPLEGASVRARKLDGGEAYETRTGTDGRYEIRLPAGDYDLFVTLASYNAQVRRDIEVMTGATRRLDVRMPEGGNHGTPGEYAFLLFAQGQEAPTGPVRRTADGRPDLSGVWFPSENVDPEEPPYRPWAREVARQRATEFGKDDPRSSCLPTGVPRTMRLDLTKLVQTPELLVILIEGSPPGFRQVFLDGRGHPPDLQPSWMGHSVGSWDGDTLVIDSTGFNDKGWIDLGGQPQTEELRVTERFHRADLGRMDVEITIDDPGAYERPWTIRRTLKLAQGFEILEYVCNENLKTEHMVGSGTGRQPE